MENFVLYEEVGRGEHSIVYKGRRKGTIHFVAIHCIDKVKRPEITNLVRLSHEVEHANVVKFYEWYETSNHLWLVVELCTGGSLETVITQDDHLPESAIRRFGIDLIKGLHHIHSLGIIFSDIKPSKILLDGPGVLKFADFGLSRVEGENLEELFDQFADVSEPWASHEGDAEADAPKKYKTQGSPTYMAPEVLQRNEHSIMSDLWSLGAIFYEMYTGHPPFLADNFEQLMDKIVNKELPAPRVKGARVSGKPSPDFQNLLEGLLQKNLQKRVSWGDLVTHPFWQGELHNLAQDIESAAPEDVRQSVRQSIANFSTRTSVASELPKVNSVLGQVHGVVLQEDEVDAAVEDLNTLNTTDRPDSTMSFRPMTAPGSGDSKVSFTISSRPPTAVTNDPSSDEHLTLTSPQKLMTLSPVNARETLHKAKQHQEMTEEKGEVAQLIYHTSDFTVTSIVDNPKIQKLGTLKFDSKTLQVPPYPVSKILSLPSREQEKHAVALAEALAVGEKGPPSQKRVQLLSYTVTIATNPQIANWLIKKNVLSTLARQLKECQHVEIKGRLGRVLGTIANSASEVDPSTSLAEPNSILTEVVRDNFRNAKVKAAVLPALGELLYLVSAQEEIKGCAVEAWTISSMTYTLIIKCLREGEESIVNHYAAKIVENVATTTGQHSQKFAVNEVGQLLWYVFTHATADSLRITALSALSRLTKLSVAVFQSVIEKVGLPKMLNTMSLPVSRIQQAVITMFASLITSDGRFSRILQAKEFTLHTMRLLESPSVVIRGKAFLVLLETIKLNQETLLICCQNRLVMYVERDGRRQAIGKVENPGQIEYLCKCLELLVTSLVDMVPAITKEILSSLEAVSGRKHPSTVQIKQLKSCLPLTSVLHHLISSQVFRPKIINNHFICNLGTFLTHVKSIDAGTTQIQGATGPSGTEEFIHSIFAVVESLAQHPTVLIEYHELVIDKLLPSLAALVCSSCGDTRALSLRLFTEMATIYLNQEQFEPNLHKSQTKKLHQIIAETLLPQYEQVLLEQDPLPSYGLKLLLALLEQNSAFIREFEKLGLVPVLFQVLIDHQNNPVSGTMQQIAGILNCLLAHKETNMKELYEQGFVDHLTTLFADVATICVNSQESTDLKGPNTILLSLLDSMHVTLKYVSEVVRKALQAKKGGGDTSSREAEQAEALLLINKPFTHLTSMLTQLLMHDDTDVADMSLKCLSLLVQLFGGEQADAMSVDNMLFYSEALKQADAKKQKIILRIIKRMISTEKVHAEMLSRHGGLLAETIKSLVQTASSHAEVALSSLAAEILKVGGYLK